MWLLLLNCDRDLDPNIKWYKRRVERVEPFRRGERLRLGWRQGSSCQYANKMHASIFCSIAMPLYATFILVCFIHIIYTWYKTEQMLTAQVCRWKDTQTTSVNVPPIYFRWPTSTRCKPIRQSCVPMCRCVHRCHRADRPEEGRVRERHGEKRVRSRGQAKSEAVATYVQSSFVCIGISDPIFLISFSCVSPFPLILHKMDGVWINLWGSILPCVRSFPH